MNYDINFYNENTEKLQQQNLKLKNAEDDNDILKNEISDKYYKLERDIRDKKYQEEKEVRDNFNRQKFKIELESEELKKQNANLRKILELKQLSKKEIVDLDDFKVYYYDYPKRENGDSDYSKGKIEINYKPIDEIKQEKLSLKVYITKNDKPKNKYSLIVVGRTFFDIEMFENNRLFDSWIKAHTDYNVIKISIKDFPSEKEALDYYQKGKEKGSLKVLNGFLEQQKNLTEEYNNMIENTNSKGWDIALLEKELYYFKRHYSNGGKDEPRYKEIVKELEQLKRLK